MSSGCQKWRPLNITVCNRLARAWEQVPDFRFGQFMVNALGAMNKDPFFPEDDEMIEHIENYVRHNSPYYKLPEE